MTQDYLLEHELKTRAKLILDIKSQENLTKEEIQEKYYQKIKKYHPDKNKKPFAKEISSLIIEAYNYLKGVIIKPTLLKKEALYSMIINNSKDKYPIPQSYNKWATSQGFYDFINPNQI